MSTNPNAPMLSREDSLAENARELRLWNQLEAASSF